MNQTMQETDITQVIKGRRTIKPDKMNGRVIPEETIYELLAMADWAPTHARTEPWRYIVISNNQVKNFTARHANLFKQHTDPTSFVPEKFQKLLSLGENASHIIIALMKRNSRHKVPEIEEIAATAASVQNLLLTATSKGIATFWSSSGLTHHQALKDEFKLGDEDRILGIIYLGYSDEPPREGIRMIPLSEKIEWVR